MLCQTINLNIMTTKTFNRLRDIIVNHPECFSYHFDSKGRAHIEALTGRSSIYCITTAKGLARLLSDSSLV